MSLRVLPVAALAVLAFTASARADFGPPVEVAPGLATASVAAATDAAGTTSAIVTGTGGPWLVSRPRGAEWPAPQAFPGTAAGSRSIVGPVVSAAGRGALAVAWRIDRPRAYGGIGVAVRDPGTGALEAPATIADETAGGVRHPAIAIDRAGDAVLAYDTGTNAAHLNVAGGIAVALRPAGRPFGERRIVESRLSGPPAVAIARDGRGVVAWSRSRRVYAVTVDTVAGTMGAVKMLSGAAGVSSLVAAAGPGGAATVAWVTHRTTVTGRRSRSSYWIAVARRPAGHQFAAPVAVGKGATFVRDVALAADEAGTATLAWTPMTFGRDHSVGINGITTTTRTATAAPGRPFAAPRVLVPAGDASCTTPSIAAAAGRTALAWACVRHDGHQEFQAAVGAPDDSVPSTITTTDRAAPMMGSIANVVATLDAQGTASIFLVRADPVTSPTPGIEHIIGVMGD
ncbi:MAG TPA: hypothetical protein VK501_03640 [Baekduia sp.]|uniref:hypothetical protein n=1 Tax=Baekduia sp. TaxID=2600305 RepID=UPI002C69923C|nr:hypothetical protein [Baekduia sp.]HMJ32988.1 hypothetical protein [Baekduia sp.]